MFPATTSFTDSPPLSSHDIFMVGTGFNCGVPVVTTTKDSSIPQQLFVHKLQREMWNMSLINLNFHFEMGNINLCTLLSFRWNLAAISNSKLNLDRGEKKKSFENERLKEDGDRRRQTGSAVKDDADAISSVNSRLFSSVFLPE